MLVDKQIPERKETQKKSVFGDFTLQAIPEKSESTVREIESVSEHSDGSSSCSSSSGTSSYSKSSLEPEVT